MRGLGISEKDFVALMNQKAQKLGMKDTFFADPTGLNPHNVSTAYDLVILGKTAFSNEMVLSALNKKQYIFRPNNKRKNKIAYSTDKLLNSFLKDEKSEYKLIAGKTGYLDEAGYCFLAKAENSKKEKIIVAILGAKSNKDRFQETKNLIWWAYNK